MAKLFVKFPLQLLMILLLAFSATAQDSNCALTESPSLQGLSLGISPAEVQSVFGKDLKIKIKQSGDRSFFQNYIGKTAPAKLNDVRALYLRFLDGKLYQIEIFYEDRSDVPTLEVFAANLSAQIKFPSAASWQFVKNKAVIDCGAFTLVAEKLLNPRIELTDTAKFNEAKARRKKSD